MAGLALLAIGPGPHAGDDPGEAPPAAEPPRLVRLEPGAEVRTGPPAGWTHRVIRSLPRLAKGDLSSLPDSARPTATLLRTVIAAEVVDSPGGTYRLARVGVGNAIPVGDREIVTTPDGPRFVLETLGLVERVVLRTADAKLDEGQLIARTPTFALLRTPSVLAVNGRHTDVDLHYGLLVDPVTGTLSTLVWAVPAGSRAAPAEITELSRDLSWSLTLDVRVSRRVGPIPVAWSFAMSALPPGRRLAVPEAVARTLTRLDPGQTNPDLVECSLRALVDF